MAKKDVNVVSSLVGKGLEREYLLLKALLNAHDVYTVGFHYTNYAGSVFTRADINIFLEVVMPNVFNLSRENWLVPNCEWWDARNDQFLSYFTKVLCKTHDCERVWRAKLVGDRPERCVYTGFEARDLYDPTIPRENKFLHVAGESEFKNTEAVVGAWRNGMLSNIAQRPPLTVVTRQKRFQELCEGVPDVTCIPRVSEEQLVELMNSHRFHLIPSAYEGYGHSIHESLMCGGLVITTDVAPMNEFAGIVKDWTIPVVRTEPRALAQLNWVDEHGVEKVMQRVIAAFDAPNFLEHRSVETRAAALADRESFRRRFLALVGVT